MGDSESEGCGGGEEEQSVESTAVSSPVSFHNVTVSA